MLAGNFGLRYLFRRAEQRAVDATIFADRAKERVVEAAEAAARQEFLTEFWSRQISGDPVAATAPTVPKVLRPSDRRYPDHIDALAAYERARLMSEPRPWSLLGPRLVALQRLHRLAARVRALAEHERLTGEGKPLRQAQTDLATVWAAYRTLVKDGTPMPDDDELLVAGGWRDGSAGAGRDGSSESGQGGSGRGGSAGGGRSGLGRDESGGSPASGPRHWVFPSPVRQGAAWPHYGAVTIGGMREVEVLPEVVRPDWTADGGSSGGGSGRGEAVDRPSAGNEEGRGGIPDAGEAGRGDDREATGGAGGGKGEGGNSGGGQASDGQSDDKEDGGGGAEDCEAGGGDADWGETGRGEVSAGGGASGGGTGRSEAGGGDADGGETRQGEAGGGAGRGGTGPGEAGGGVDGEESGGEAGQSGLEGVVLYSGRERLWPDELADLITESPLWDGGAVRLIVKGGALDPLFVRRLADLLGVDVLVEASVLGGDYGCSSGTVTVLLGAAPGWVTFSADGVSSPSGPLAPGPSTDVAPSPS
jgi:hypothetical protein